MTRRLQWTWVALGIAIGFLPCELFWPALVIYAWFTPTQLWKEEEKSGPLP
jgi:hypothetical protein